MRKQFLIPLLLLVVSASVLADVTSHTFFSVRPNFQSAFPEKITMFRNNRAKVAEDGWMGAMEAVVFGGESTRSKKLARFFLPFGKDTLVFAENNAPAAGGLVFPNVDPHFRDVNSVFFNIQTVGGNFQSTVAFRPRQTYVGGGFDWIQYFGWGCDPCDKRWWFEVSFPVVNVRNEVRLTESVQSQGVALNANVNANVIEAFQGLKPFFSPVAGVAGLVTGSPILFGKIDGRKSKTGVADVEIKLGYDWACEECYHAYSYVGVVVPTGNKPKGEFVFEPIVGNNHHVGVMWGSAFGFELWRGCDGNKALWWEMETNGRYLFRNTQTRSFDLINKEWSRYQLVFVSQADAQAATATEGINVFTQRVRVKPRFSFDFNSGLVFTACGFEGELGYNFWARQAEKVSLKEPFFDTIALSAVPVIAPPGAINRAITIREEFTGANVSLAANAAQRYTNNRVQEQDLDLSSAAHPCALSHTVYGSLGYNWDCLCWPVFAGIGGSYEFASCNTALERWMVWGKLGISI